MTSPTSSHWASSWKLWGSAFLVAGVVAIVWDLSSISKKETHEVTETAETAATFIPAGFVLVPIEVENYEALDSILGSHGVVDLYKPNEKPNGRPYKVASHVKILRAPLNPSHFAVLAPETQSRRLVAFAGAFNVVVQNPNSRSGTEFEDTDAAEGAGADHASIHDAKNAAPLKNLRLRSRIVIEVNDAN